ncbi:MAG: TolC family protein, partial [Candidatus Cloacimonadota bacterium]|nr:TolC family protein [Candidatus Cloacimonadota bacterium]
MKNKVLIIVLLTISLLFSKEISLKQAEDIALRDNNEILSKKEELKASKYSMLNSYSSLLPSASLTGGYTKPDDPVATLMGQEYESTTSYGYNISQPLFSGGKILLSAMMQKNSYQITKRELEQKKIEIIRMVREKYYSVL